MTTKKKKNTPTTVTATVAPRESLCKSCKKSCKTNLMVVSHCGNYLSK
jgi:hypothetical protein